jgi:hypothetical protein
VKRYTVKCAIYLILAVLISIPFISNAISGVGEGDIQIELTPQIPIPGKSVTVTLTSYATDLNKASISWKDSANNVLISGVGETSYELTAGAPNSNIVLIISIIPAGDTVAISKQISIHPSDVDILWQVENAHTPPFYKGKALATSESVISAIAMPSGGAVARGKSNLVYVWKLEHNTINKSSGYGKDKFQFKNSYLRTIEHVDVNASSVNGSYNASNTVAIPIVDAKLLFYLKNDHGMTEYKKALSDDTELLKDEATFVAEPYFFPMDDADFTWKINGATISTPKNPQILTIRPASKGGYATISLSIESISRLFQSISSTLKLNL